jgi:hypothetical protein
MNKILLITLIFLLAMSSQAQTYTGLVGDKDGFGFGTPVGGNVPINVFDNRTVSDASFTDHTIPDTGGSVNFSFPISVGTTFSLISDAFFTMNLQEVEFPSSGIGERIFLDGVELQGALSDYTINGIPQTGSGIVRFFDTVVSQGDFHTDVVQLRLPSSLFPSLLDGSAAVTVQGGGESYAIDYAELTIVAAPEPTTLSLLALGSLGFVGLRRRHM